VSAARRRRRSGGPRWGRPLLPSLSDVAALGITSAVLALVGDGLGWWAL